MSLQKIGIDLREFLLNHWIGLGVGSIGWLVNIFHYTSHYFKYGHELPIHFRTLDNILVLTWIPGFMLAGYLYDRKLMLVKKLAESERRYRDFIEHAGDAIIAADCRGRILLVNKQAMELTGYSTEELLKMRVPQLFVKEKRDGYSDAFETCCKIGASRMQDALLARKDGGEVYVDINYSLISLDGEDVNMGIFRDMTERKKAEKKLRESEEKFRGLAEKSLVGVYLIQDGVFKYVNPRLAGIFGYRVDELIEKKGPRDLVLPEDWPIVKGNLQKRISGEVESLCYDFRGITKTKETIYVEVYGSRTTYQGRPAVIGTLLDVTERRHAEEELRRKTERIAVISELGRIISSSLDIREVYDAFANGVKRLIDYDRISIALYDEERDAIRMHLVRTKGESKIPEGSWRPKKGTVIGYVIDTGKPFIRRNALEEREFMEDEVIVPEGLRSYVAVPLYSKGKVIGTFNLGSSRPDTYSEEDLEVLEDLSKQLAIAVENSLLYRELSL
jgi:PAS domain S-box-containing protein